MVILKAVVNHECCEGFDAVVEFVFPQFRPLPLEPEMRPVDLLNGPQIIVVLYGCESFFESRQIQLWVEGVSRDHKGVEPRSVLSTVLVLCQVF